jgi:hypothetical protein
LPVAGAIGGIGRYVRLVGLAFIFHGLAGCESGVTEPTSEQLEVAEEILLNSPELDIVAGDTVRLQSTVLGKNGKVLGRSGSQGNGAANGYNRFVWSSSDPSVATVDNGGLIEAVDTGSVVITVSYAKLSTDSEVKVRGKGNGKALGATGGGDPDPDPDPQSVVVDPEESKATALGASVQLSAKVLDAWGTEISSPSLTWASQKPEVASVDQKGKVTARALGMALIVAVSGGVADTARVCRRSFARRSSRWCFPVSRWRWPSASASPLPADGFTDRRLCECP